jgi:hypothetical protein
VPSQNGLGLVLVNLHDDNKPLILTLRALAAQQ